MKNHDYMAKVLTLLLALLLGNSLHAAPPALSAKRIGSGFARPVFVTAPRGDTNRLFILEQHTGRIRILNLPTLTTNNTPFLQLTGLATGSEQGLLGLAFHPNYASNGFFYVNITVTGGDTEIRRYTVSSTNANIANAASSKLILTFDQPQSNHNAGWMDFGPDGFLYIASGDGGGADDLHGTIGNAQDRNSLLGKMLRIDVDGGDPYAIPNGNPFKGDGTKKQEIWAFGLRNPWRCSFDRNTGDLWIGDVGQNAREEIDFLPSGVAGVNFGWRPREGFIQNTNYDGSPYAFESPVTTATDPVHDYPRTSGFSVTGGYRYRGSEIPGLQESYLFADYGTARFWSFQLENGAKTNFLERTTELRLSGSLVGNISSFGEDANGEVYFCDLTRGNIFKIVNAQPAVTDIIHDNSQFRFSFEGYANRTYTVENKSPLGTNGWNSVSNFVTSAYVTNFTFVTNLGTSNQFYRVRTN